MPKRYFAVVILFGVLSGSAMGQAEPAVAANEADGDRAAVRNRHIIVTIKIGAIIAMHGRPGARAARLMRLLPPDPRRASRLHLPVLSRPRKTHPRLLGPGKLTLATDFWRSWSVTKEAC